MFRKSTVQVALTFVLLLFGNRSALAGRVVHFDILLDNKTVLVVHLLDQGKTGPDTAWNYLKTHPLKNPADLFVHSAEEESRLRAFKIEPSKDDPLKATLKGKLRIFCRYAGDVRCNELRLVREDEKSRWFIDPKQVDELAKKRTVDPKSRVREVIDAAAKAEPRKEPNNAPPPPDTQEKQKK